MLSLQAPKDYEISPDGEKLVAHSIFSLDENVLCEVSHASTIGELHWTQQQQANHSRDGETP